MSSIYTTLTLKINRNHRCIYLIYPVVMATGVRYILSSWQRESYMSHCCGNMPGYISGPFHFWSIACMTSSLYYIQFNKCICNLTSEYFFILLIVGLKCFLIYLMWYILKWYISLISY